MNISEISINYNPQIKVSELPKIESSKDAETYFRSIWSPKIEYIEESYMLLLNRANKALGCVKISAGGTTGTVIDVKLIFHAALKSNAQILILAHNHPSGNLQPSKADIDLTGRVKEAGKLMEIPLLDHLIITAEGFYSMADEGIFP